VDVKLPEQLAQIGAKKWGEYRKNGDKWEGAFKRQIPCTDAAFLRTPTQKMCQTTMPTEITLMTPTKIEGFAIRPPEGAKFNCQKCAFDGPTIQENFTWIPAEE